MKKFTLIGNITFQAEDLNDAFEILSQHFKSLHSLDWVSPLEFTGNLTVQPNEEIEGIGPEFAAEIEKFYFDLAEKQEDLGDPFEKILHENLWDLYVTD
jgi:hypothetical protein